MQRLFEILESRLRPFADELRGDVQFFDGAPVDARQRLPSFKRHAQWFAHFFRNVDGGKLVGIAE